MASFLGSLTTIVVFLAIAAGLFFAYNAGYLDPVIEKIGTYIFRAEAKAEEKKLEAQGLKAGQDFLTSELKGSQHADELQRGIGSLGGLKKNL